MIKLKKTDRGYIIDVFIYPGADKNEVKGAYRDGIKIKIKAQPVKGKANKMCIKYLASVFGVSKSSVSIVSGEKSRNKKILLSGELAEAGEEELKKRIESLISL